MQRPQNIAEIRALTGWLLDEGCPSVGLLGFSFGGWLAGLTACNDTRIACAVLTIPAVQLGANPRLEEAIQFLKSLDFIPAQSAPAQLEFDQSGRHFRFPTPRPGRFPENNTVYGRLYRCGKCWQERPVIILLHGAGGADYHLEFPFMARCCNRAGFNAAMLLAPFQFQRRPHQLAGLSWPDYRLVPQTTNE